MSDKMREEFEAWAVGQCDWLDIEEEREGDGYRYYTGWWWEAWKASRESLVIELPKGDSLARRTCGPQACGANPLISRFDAVEAIEAAGLKVKP